MSDQEILTKAITEAIYRGYKIGYGEQVAIIVDNLIDYYEPMNINDVIYNHDFAKALWGVTHPDKQALLGDGVGDLGQPEWQYHLQQMVIADDPIKYLGDNI